jgi:hypothetical protein
MTPAAEKYKYEQALRNLREENRKLKEVIIKIREILKEDL